MSDAPLLSPKKKTQQSAKRKSHQGDHEVDLGKEASRCGPYIRKGVVALSGALILVALFIVSRHLLASARTHISVVDSKSLYTDVQYLGFNLFTTPGSRADGCVNDDGKRINECYIGSNDTDTDLSARASLLGEVINNAHNSLHWDRRSTTLKIFMVPEFYWRGVRGAYRLDPTLSKVSAPIATEIEDLVNEARFHHWLFILGTIVFVEEHGSNPEDLASPFQNLTYYNVAPIHVGGSRHKLLMFKEYISNIDFIKMSPHTGNARSGKMVGPFGTGSNYCRKHWMSNGCRYGKVGQEIVKDFGFGEFEVMTGNILGVGNLRVGIEICLDHVMGVLDQQLSEDETVDVHLIVSAGMHISAGPVCTKRNGPVFVADGFARTSMSLNIFGAGRNFAVLPNGEKRYNIGLGYGADVMTAIEQWICDTVWEVIGTGFGSRPPGLSTLPGGSRQFGETGVHFRQLSALGEGWSEKLRGYYTHASYEAAGLLKSLYIPEWRKAIAAGVHIDVKKPQVNPTVDIYGPVPIPL